jgi:hypothetical protein
MKISTVVALISRKRWKMQHARRPRHEKQCYQRYSALTLVLNINFRFSKNYAQTANIKSLFLLSLHPRTESGLAWNRKFIAKKKRNEKLKRNFCQRSFNATFIFKNRVTFHCFMFDSLAKYVLHFRWISICFMIAKNVCLRYICIFLFLHVSFLLVFNRPKTFFLFRPALIRHHNMRCFWRVQYL